MTESDRRMSPLARDVLLASSGELPYLNRPWLWFRLLFDPRARALAGTLDTVSAATSARAERRMRLLPVLAVASVAAVLAATWFDRRVSRDPDLVVVVGEPMHAATSRLLIATTQLDTLAAPTTWPAARSTWPRIPSPMIHPIRLFERERR